MAEINCFTFLGLPEEHRSHPVMLVKHRDEVPAAKLTLPVYAQVKKDGIFSMTIVRNDNNVGIFGRTGKKLQNVSHLEVAIAERQWQPGIYFGELQTMAIDSYLESLSGVVNPNRTEPLDFIGEQVRDGLYIDYFDMMTLGGFVEGSANTGFCSRHMALTKRLAGRLFGNCDILPYTRLGSEEEVEAFAQKCIDAKEEGAVFKLDDGWLAGHKGYRQTKIVRMVSYDLTCIGWEEGKGKYEGKVANLIFKWKNGKTIKAMLGRGWTHADAERMFHDIKYGGELNVIGKIFAVKALQESSKGVLRLPKAGELRHDKEQPDVF